MCDILRNMNYRDVNRKPLLISICVSVMTLSCSILGGSGEEYQSSKSLPPLEVPPDLTKPNWNSRMAIPSRHSSREISAVEDSPDESSNDVTLASASGENVLPEVKDITVRREGSIRWLEAIASTESLWPKLHQFWIQQDIELEREDPQVGVMETVWYERNDVLPKNALARMLGRTYDLLSDTGVRDKYRLRLERVDNEITNIYLTQQRAEQVGDVSDDEARVKWRLKPANRELEAEMLVRLMVFLGATQEEAKRRVASSTQEEAERQVASSTQEEAERQVGLSSTDQPRPLILKKVDGVPVLFVTDEFASVWQRTGVALDRAGLFVEHQDKVKGVYQVTYTGQGGEQEGFFSRLFSSEKQLELNKLYQVQLRKEGDQILITAHDDVEDDAAIELHPDAAEKLLERLKSAYHSNGNNV